MLTVDVANYAGRLSAATVACWAAQGITHAVIRLSLEDQARIALARQQIAACRDGGLGISGYIWGYLRDDPGAAMGAALLTYSDLDLTMWALDIEETSAPKDARANADWTGGALATLDAAGVRYCLYTARWYWTAWLGDTTEFAHVPLWVADWDGVADLGRWRRFGGWAEAVGKQHVGDTQLCGVGVDLNVFDSAWLMGAAAPPEEVPVLDYTFPIVRYQGPVTNHWGTSERGGSDLFAPRGAPVVAMCDSVIASASYDTLGGYNVLAKGLHDGLTFYYAHLDGLAVRTGQRVAQGDELGPLGDTGNAKNAGPHLHIGIGWGIINGSGPSGGCGRDFDAVGLLQRALGGGSDEENDMTPEVLEQLSYLGGLTADVLPAVVRELETVEGRRKADREALARALAALRPHAVMGE